jgi:cytochrome c oxidase cbb3-type subunit I
MFIPQAKEVAVSAPYYLMAFLYLALAGFAVLDTALVNFQLLPALPNLRWLIIHLVVLGGLTQFVFGALPAVVAARERSEAPPFRWTTWLLLNVGLAILVLGVVVMNLLLITTGGTFIFISVMQLAWRLLQVRRARQGASSRLRSGSRLFYLAGLAYLLTGILVGTGLWQGWSIPLRISIPKEVHVHANLWGFTALVFAGLLLDLAPHLNSHQSISERRISLIFWLMNLGAFGLVLGPWLDIDLLQVVGLSLHTVGSILLWGGVLGSFWKVWRGWTPGAWHLVLAYIWFFLPVIIAPLVVVRLGVGSEVAGNGGPILIFGWVLQFTYAVLPFMLGKTSLAGRSPVLGGTWLSLAAVNAGSILYWTSLFLSSGQELLRGTAFLLWLVSLLPFLLEVGSILRKLTEQVWEANSDLSR